MTNRAVRERLLASTIIAGALIAAAPAMAQNGVTPQDTGAGSPPGVQAADSTNNTSNAQGEIVVTGTLIRNPNLVSSSPVNVVNEKEITLRAPNNAEEALRSLPGVVPGIGNQVNNGATGVNTVDLRGLGAQRNVVLLDGSRVVPSLANGAVDTNVIPIALLQRTDVLTGGASTTYGADAVSGVVNFITRRDFSGVDFRATYKIPATGEGRSYRADLTVGANFAEDRGNAVLSIGYTRVNAIYQTRPFALFGINPTNGVASGSSFTSVPTTLSFPSADLQVNPSSSALIPQYQGFNFNPYNIFQTPVESKRAYAATRYEVSDKIEVYARTLFSQNTVQTIIAPSGIFGDSLSVPANNPYLNAAIRNQICAQNFASQSANAAAATDPTSQAAYAADAARYAPGACAAQTGSTAFVAPTVNAAGVVTVPGTAGNSLDIPGVYRRLVELGPRLENFQTTVYDARVGLTAQVTDSISFDVSGSYGRSEQIDTRSGYTLKSRIQQALVANNTSTCVNTANNCVPLNLFGQAGSITPAQVAFIQGQSTIRVVTDLKQMRGVFSGDFGYTSPFASKPVNFAVGGEYRSYAYSRVPDAFAQNPSELGGAGGAVLPFSGGYNVKEGFAELIAPLVSDKPFFDELTAEAGARYSSYSVQAPGKPSFSTWTYKGGLTWEPVQSFRFRANYQRAVRAPNIGELFAPTVTGLTSLTVDPCAGSAPLNNANLRAVCLAQGAPAASIGSIQNPSAGQANATGGGNPNIKPEKADTITAGIVVTPRGLIPGFNLSVDYYHIVVNNAITAATPDDVIAACFGNITAASASSSACTSIRRGASNGRLSGPASTVAGLPVPLTNNGRYATDGIDVTANYNRRFGNVGLDLNFTGNYTRSFKFRASPTSLNRECVRYYSANCGPTLGQIIPKISWNQRTTVSLGGASLSLLWRHIGSARYEPGLKPLYSGVVTNAPGASTPYAGQTLDFNRIKAYNYFDLAAQFNITERYQLTLGVQNLVDKLPPITGSPNAGTTTANGGNTFPSTYDAIGRTFSASVRVKF